MIAMRRLPLVFGIFLTLLLSFPCFADEIMFLNQKGSQTGVIVGEDDQRVTIRFPKETIKSINKSGDEHAPHFSGKVIWGEGKDYLILKIPRRSIQIVPQKTGADMPSIKQESVSTGFSQKNEKAIRTEAPT